MIPPRYRDEVEALRAEVKARDAAPRLVLTTAQLLELHRKWRAAGNDALSQYSHHQY